MRRINKRTCDACRLFASRRGEEPSCWQCRPEILPENTDALRIWNIVQGQRILAGFGETIALNHLALWEAIDRYKIQKPIECFEKVLHISGEIFEQERLERKAKENAKDV